MAMNINKIFARKTAEESPFPGSFKRSSASMMDMVIVLVLRSVVAQLLGSLFMNQIIQDFLTEFHDKFGTETVKSTPEHIDFVIHHKFFYAVLICYAIVIFVGALYYSLLNSSAWQATIGKRLSNMVIVKNSGNSRPSFGLALEHYFLSTLPFLYIFYIVIYQNAHKTNFFDTITASPANVFFGILFIGWVQIHLITKRKVTAYDLICNTTFKKGRTAAKFPWSRVEEGEEF